MAANRHWIIIGLALIYVVSSGTPVRSQTPKKLDPWTPRPAVGKAEPWEKGIEANWVDDRFQKMDTGPFLNATFKYEFHGNSVKIYKGTAIRLHDVGGIIFDRESLRMMTAWKGGFVSITDKRFGLLSTPEPVGKLIFGKPLRSTDPVPVDTRQQYKGLYLNGDRVIVHYRMFGKDRYESPEVAPDGTIYSEQMTTPIQPGPKRWGDPIVTKLVKGNDNDPLAIDTLTIPYKNRFNALFFCTGLDFLKDGRIAVCTAHGDVWLVTVDENAETCSWQRYATGLYQPLGLMVVDGKVVVLERGQITRLHDNNDDGEADYYENINSDWHLSGGEHSYNTCLETDPQGNFYFFATGDTDTPTGGSLIKVSADGSKMEQFATGFRHPIGLGMSPDGVITGADQEGNWMPATRIDEYVQGGFYGDMRAHHRQVPPTIYNGPLCWLPREVDNSAGGQVWVPQGTWGELGGLPLHLSYGRCKMFILLRQPLKNHPTAVSQGGVWDLNLGFLSGVCRGRFHDGDLYVCGLNGWQTSAKADGCLQRVRRTDKPLGVPVKLEVVGHAVEITFNKKLDAKTVKDQQFAATWWNYHWSESYGSQRYKPSNDTVGQETVPIESIQLLENQKTVRLSMPELEPVMQLHIGIKPILTVDGTLIAGSIYMTVHQLPKE